MYVSITASYKRLTTKCSSGSSVTTKWQLPTDLWHSEWLSVQVISIIIFSAYHIDITESELLKSLKAVKNNKSPGTDGLTSEFYKFFWSDIKIFLLDSLQYALDNKHFQ